MVAWADGWEVGLKKGGQKRKRRNMWPESLLHTVVRI